MKPIYHVPKDEMSEAISVRPASLSAFPTPPLLGICEVTVHFKLRRARPSLGLLSIYSLGCLQDTGISFQ